MTVRQRATIDDVARLAGVSPKTVSRVYSHSAQVSEKTTQQVLTAATRLRFRPNMLARSLRRGGSSTTVGFIMGELSNPFYYTVASGIEKELAAHGMTLIVATTDDSSAGEQRVADTLLSQRVGALLLVPVSDDQSYLDGERHLGTPIIAIDRPARNLVADSVVLANHRGAFDATTALIEQGHTRIAYVCHPASVYTQIERVGGYHAALERAGISPRPQWEALLDTVTEQTESAIRALLSSPDAPTAIIAGNNRVCISALRVIREHGSRTALIGFDDFETADVLNVSVVGHDPAEMGRRAAQLAIERMANPTAQPTQIVLPTRLIARGSGERAVPLGSLV